jgi:single-strand DNA-binding protein
MLKSGVGGSPFAERNSHPHTTHRFNRRTKEHSMNFNQLTIIGYIGKNAETKQLPNGSPVTKFSVATTRSWKDDKGERKDKTQWHNVVAYGQGFAQIAPRLAKGTHVFVQGELTTRDTIAPSRFPAARKRSSM